MCSRLIALPFLLRLLVALLLLILASLLIFLIRFLGVTRNACPEKYQQCACCDKSFSSCHGSYLVATRASSFALDATPTSIVRGFESRKWCCLALHSSEWQAAA